MKLYAHELVTAFLGALFVLLVSPVDLWSQAAGGSISGYVYDATGAVVSETGVQVVNTDTGLSRTVKSDGRGYYIVTPLPVGNYDVVFTREGFNELRRTGVFIEVGQSAALDARLQVGRVQDSVVVTEAVPLIEPTKSGAESVIVDSEIRELPLNNRNWNDLAVLLPGVAPDGEFDSVTTVSINGQEGAFNNIQVDGVDNNNTFFAELRGRGRAPFQYSQEAVQEFRILNSAYLAEHGRSAGGVINAVTKSGTNEWHGSGFWYIRDNALNAAPFFAKQAGLGKPEGRRQQFGGTIGGPLKRDKLFLFFSYDQQVRTDPVAIVFDAQTNDELSFDPRDVLNSTIPFQTVSNTFFDTVDGTGNRTLIFTDGVSALERDIVQQAFVNWAFARAYFLGDTSFLDQTFTIAGTNVTTINPFPGRQFASVPRIAGRNPDQITFFPKITWIINQSHNLSAQWNYQNFEVGPNGIETQASQDENESTSGPLKNRSDALVANLNSVFGPNWVNEFRFQYVRDDEDVGANAPGLPEIDVALFDLGGRGSLPRFGHEDKWQWQNNTSWLRGRHRVKFGADVVLTFDDNFFPGDFSGVYDFDGPGHWMELSRAFISLTNPVAGRNYFGINAGGTGPRPITTANFLLRDYTQRFGQALTNHTTVDYGFYVQDTFQLNPRLTLNLGLRYEYQKLQEPILPNPLVPETAIINQDTNNFAPRIGLAWSPADNIVLRAGYGLYYIRTSQIDVQAALAGNNAFSFNQFLTGSQANTAGVLNFNPAAMDPLSLQGVDFPILSAPTTACPAPPACADPFASVSAFAADRENGYTQQASVELQWEFTPRHSFTLGYVHTKGTKLPRNRNINVLNQAFAESNPLVASFFDADGNLIRTIDIPDYQATSAANRPNPNFNAITFNESAANTFYNALLASFERRWDDGLVAGASYTWSHNHGDLSNGFNNSGAFFSDLLDQNQPELERGNSRLDQRHRFVGRAVWEPQFWRKSVGATRWLLDGWSWGFIYTAASGRPITPVMLGDVNRDNARTAFGAGDRVPFLGRGSVRVQGRNQLDLSIYKRFRVGEGRSLQFRAQAFNLANRTTFTQFDDVMFFVANGDDPGTLVVEDRIMTPNPNFLGPEGRALRNRDIQMGLVFRF